MKKKIIIIATLISLVVCGAIGSGVNLLVVQKVLDAKDTQEVKKEEPKKEEVNKEEENVNEEEKEEIEPPQEEIKEEEKDDEVDSSNKPSSETNTNSKPNNNTQSNNNTKPTTNSNNNNNTTTNNNNSNNSSNNNNNNNQTTETKPKKELVSTTNETRSTDSYKYGTKITKTTTYEVKTYSDGTKEEKELSSKYSYDFSTFNGHTEDMKAEATQVATSNQKIYEEVLNYTNKYRSEGNKNALTLDKNLSIAATVRAIEMAYAHRFSHARPFYKETETSSCFTVLDDLSISYWSVAENIAWNYPTSEAVTIGWRNSEGHYKNMMGENYTKLGVGMYKLNGETYWVQIFTN